MHIVNYSYEHDKDKIVSDAYKVCSYAHFLVTYDDVYAHLFGREDLILKLLVDNYFNVYGFGVFEIFNTIYKEELIRMLYLSGMVISPEYQGKNISSKIIKNTYEEYNTDLVSLRTQNIRMLKALFHSFDNKLLSIPGSINKDIIEYLRGIEPFKNIDNNGIIRNIYETQLYSDLSPMKDIYNLELNSTDSVAVLVKPCKKNFIK